MITRATADFTADRLPPYPLPHPLAALPLSCVPLCGKVALADAPHQPTRRASGVRALGRSQEPRDYAAKGSLAASARALHALGSSVPPTDAPEHEPRLPPGVGAVSRGHQPPDHAAEGPSAASVRSALVYGF